MIGASSRKLYVCQLWTINIDALRYFQISMVILDFSNLVFMGGIFSNIHGDIGL